MSTATNAMAMLPDERGSTSDAVALNSWDATLDVIAAPSSGRVSSLSQGLFRHLRSAIRANTGAKAGRYYFEVEVLERLPEAPTLLLVGFSTDRSPLFLGSTSSSIGFDSKGSCCSKDTATAAPDDASRIGVLLDQEVGEGRVSVFLDGQQIGSTAIPRLHGKALFPTLTFQNVTLAVNFQSPGPERSHAFGWIAQEHLVRSSCVETTSQEVIIPVALPSSGLYDWSLRMREMQPEMVEIGDEMMAEWSASSGLSSRSGTRDDPQLSSLGIEQLRKREVWQKALMGVARSSKKSLIHSSVRRNLVEAERCSILKNFPAAKKTAVVLFGKPDEDFKDWVKQKMRLQYEAEKAELERKRSSAEAAGEEPPTEELKEPPEADFLPSGKTEVSERALAHDLRYFSLPSKAEGFDEIRYEWTDEETAKEKLLQWLRERKARQVVEGLTPGEWFNAKYEDWKKARRVFQNGQRDFSGRSQGDESLADKVAAIELSKVKDPHDADGNGTPIYGNFKYEDWIVLSFRYEFHLLCHAFPIDAADPDREGLPEEHLEHYWKTYFHHHFDPKKLGVTNLAGVLKVLKDPIELKDMPGTRMLFSSCEKEASIDVFVVAVEAYRRDRARRIEAGDESAALDIPRAKATQPAKADGAAPQKGVMRSVPKTASKAPPKAPVAKQPAKQALPSGAPSVGKAPVAKQPAKLPAQPSAAPGGKGQAKVAVVKMPAKRPNGMPSNGPPAKKPRPEERV